MMIGSGCFFRGVGVAIFLPVTWKFIITILQNIIFPKITVEFGDAIGK